MRIISHHSPATAGFAVGRVNSEASRVDARELSTIHSTGALGIVRGLEVNKSSSLSFALIVHENADSKRVKTFLTKNLFYFALISVLTEVTDKAGVFTVALLRRTALATTIAASISSVASSATTVTSTITSVASSATTIAASVASSEASALIATTVAASLLAITTSSTLVSVASLVKVLFFN